jgi:hypothetical protein
MVIVQDESSLAYVAFSVSILYYEYNSFPFMLIMLQFCIHVCMYMYVCMYINIWMIHSDGSIILKTT